MGAGFERAALGCAAEVSGAENVAPEMGARLALIARVNDIRAQLAERLAQTTPDLLIQCKTLPLLAMGLRPVLLTGETGTGKTHLAKILHEVSSRSQGPFKSVNCAGVAPDLLHAQLFGYRRGAYTGAMRDAKGLLDDTRNGTLFLDEITEMPVDKQAALLQFLDTGEYLPLGTTVYSKSNVRLVAATNREPKAAIAEGRLREDLFQRLARGGLVHVPPLRERPNDTLCLAAYFARAAAHENGVGNLRIPFSEAAQAALQAHLWTGNLRELDRVVHEAFLESCLSLEDEVGVNRLRLPKGTAREATTKAPLPNGTRAWGEIETILQTALQGPEKKNVLEEIEDMEMWVCFALQIKALKEKDYNFEKAALQLAQETSSLISQLPKRLGMSTPGVTRADLRGIIQQTTLLDRLHQRRSEGTAIRETLVELVCKIVPTPTLPEVEAVFSAQKKRLLKMCVEELGMTAIGQLKNYFGGGYDRIHTLVRESGEFKLVAGRIEPVVPADAEVDASSSPLPPPAYP